MARYSPALWRPLTCNYDSGGCSPRLIVLHIMEGTLGGTDSWFRNPSAQVSAHFGIGKDGTVIQWADTADTAWHAMGANAIGIGVELEGNFGDTPTPAQIKAAGGICAWAASVHSIPLVITNDVNGSGLAYHSLGGAAWGGHPCPGAPIVAARPAILNAARGSAMSAYGPASWDGPDWAAFDKHADTMPFRDKGPTWMMWHLAHAVNSDTTGQPAGHAAQMAALRSGLVAIVKEATPASSGVSITPDELKAVLHDLLAQAFAA